MALIKDRPFPGGPPLKQNESPPLIHRFLQQVLLAQNGIKGRDISELSTVAQVCDFISRGRLENRLMLPLHRFERMRAPATNLLPGPVGERLEIAQVGRDHGECLCERKLSNELNKKWLAHQDKASRRPRHE